VHALAGHVRDDGLRARVTDAADAAWSRVEPLAGRLPWQAVHGDVTDDNVVCQVERGLRTPDGIIDFGDLTSSWAVGVHGSGLYLGVEFVRDRATLEPATEETAAICDRMLGLGVVIQPTSDRMCVLKIKPPLCLDVAGADFFADALDRVLTEGW
jgi:hypothetical protein